MTTVIINAGIGENKDGKELREAVITDAVNSIRRYLALVAGGYTEVDTSGGWMNDDGMLVLERGKQWTVAGMDKQAGEAAAQYVGNVLNQDTVMVTYLNPEVNFHKVTYEKVERV